MQPCDFETPPNERTMRKQQQQTVRQSQQICGTCTGGGKVCGRGRIARCHGHATRPTMVVARHASSRVRGTPSPRAKSTCATPQSSSHHTHTQDRSRGQVSPTHLNRRRRETERDQRYQLPSPSVSHPPPTPSSRTRRDTTTCSAEGSKKGGMQETKGRNLRCRLMSSLSVNR